MCPFYKELDEIFSTSPTVNPPHLESSAFPDADESPPLTSEKEEDPLEFEDISLSRSSSVEPQQQKKAKNSINEALLGLQTERLEVLREQGQRKLDYMEKKDKRKYEVEMASIRLREEEVRNKLKEEEMKLKQEEIKYQREILRLRALEKGLNLTLE
jgi:hypothetical protein